MINDSLPIDHSARERAITDLATTFLVEAAAGTAAGFSFPVAKPA